MKLNIVSQSAELELGADATGQDRLTGVDVSLDESYCNHATWGCE